MKYFTKEWFQEMQVSGFLVFQETREDWDEILTYYREEGIDFQKTLREDLEYRKQDLLKYLPEPFHSYIHEGTLTTEYPSQKLREMVDQWTMDYNNRIEALNKEFRESYEENKGGLSENVIRFYENSLHDARLLSLERPANNVIIMNLDCKDGFAYFTNIKVTFTGVTEFSYTDSIEGGWWLTAEIYPNENGFDYHVLLDNPLQEMKIVAVDVMVEVIASSTTNT